MAIWSRSGGRARGMSAMEPHKGAASGQATDVPGTPPEGTGAAPSRLWRHHGLRQLRVILRRLRRTMQSFVFSSLSRRILTLNLAGLALLVTGILYLNQFREGLIDARIASLFTQGEIMSGAIAASAQVNVDTILVDPDELLRQQAQQNGEAGSRDDQSSSLDFMLNPERIAPILTRLTTPTKNRARIFDRDGALLIDSNLLYSRGQTLRFDLPASQQPQISWLEQGYRQLRYWLRHGEFPAYDENQVVSSISLPEVDTALGGAGASITRVNNRGELIVSVAVPIRRNGTVVGALQLSTQGGDIDSITDSERGSILRVFLFAACVTALMSIAMASTIATPLRRLAAAADRVRKGNDANQTLPDFTERGDEIGLLSGSLREMTDALFTRMGAIERFAADVAHELKNPLTSLRSAVETLPLARNENSRERLMAIIQHDVKRLDRLISDISDASRLDAELARERSEPVDLELLVGGIVTIQNEIRLNKYNGESAEVRLEIDEAERGKFFVLGHESRLGQVLVNIIDNARSFSPAQGVISVHLWREDGMACITIDDEGPGIRIEKIERVFERFYTDRPESEGFGNNSGLGLSISKQIIEAHRGSIAASNRVAPEKPDEILGARFLIRLPVEGG